MDPEFNNNMNAIFVQKRDGSKEEVSFDKVLRRAKSLSTSLDVNPHLVAQKICNQIYDGVSTNELDILGSEICAGLITTQSDYQILAARISRSNEKKIHHLHFQKLSKFYMIIKILKVIIVHLYHRNYTTSFKNIKS